MRELFPVCKWVSQACLCIRIDLLSQHVTMALDGELSSSGAIFSFGDNGRQTSDKGLAWV